MVRLPCAVYAAWTAALCAPWLASQVQVPDLLPTPAQTFAQEGAFRFGERIAIRVNDPSLEPHARVLQEELAILLGRLPIVGSAEGAPAIDLQLKPSDARDALGLPSEAYSFVATERRITITAASPVGISWGTATLLQAVRGDAVPWMQIRDRPRAPYRAVLVDVARSPHSIDVLRGAVRLARLYKIRFLQLHLTDDQHFTFPFAPVTDELKGNAVYSREELADLVEYADARGVTLIPEIDMPGHTSRLLQSGYLDGAKSHADVASEEHWPRLRTLIDDVIAFFPSTPYFHIGGDESGAGSRLVPFLERVNRHVRSRGKRLIVWEGFHGRPTDQIPATGEDRVLVASWESSYNTPWNLLEAGYELINASWRPLYVVGGNSRIHPGSGSGRSWSPAEIAVWNKDRFMHWEPGRPVFEDAGPGDTDRDDGIWDVPKREWRRQVLGGQISVWEQRESSLLRDLRHRVPVLAEQLWAMADDSLPRQMAAVDERVWGVVQPVEIRFAAGGYGAFERIAWSYEGDSVPVSFRNRTRLDGEVRWSTKSFGRDWNWIDFGTPDVPKTVGLSTTMRGAGVLRAALFLDGRQVGAETWARCVNWPMRVAVTEFDVGRRLPPKGVGRDGGRLPAFDGAPVARYELPMIRGPLAHNRVRGQRFDTTLVAPETGSFEITMKTQSGHAELWFDANGDGELDPSERLIAETPNTEERRGATIELEAGRRYRLRIDHVAALPRPVLLVTLDRPGVDRPREISQWLAPLREMR